MELCLGTVQFGLSYGMNNVKVSETDAENILIDASLRGIKEIDTAPAYGAAESVIGAVSKKHGLDFNINSKFLCDNWTTGAVERAVSNSLQDLQTTALSCYFMHREHYLDNNALINELLICKEKGYLRNIGVSTYEPEEALRAISHPAIDCVELPYNILDTRLDQNHLFDIAHEKGKKVYVRSAFLQGILLMEREQLLPYLQKEAWPYIQIIRCEAKNCGVSVLQFVMDFLKGSKADYLLFGVESEQQYREVVHAFEKADPNRIDFQAFRRQFARIPEKVLNPSKWRE